MPSKKKKYNARFPAGRIKKIMQTDEEVGKVAQAVPVIISRTLELFVESLLTKTLRITNARNAKTLSPSHMKQCIISESRFDFLRDLVKNIPDIGVNEEQLSGSEAGYGSNEPAAAATAPSPASTSTSSSSNGGDAPTAGTSSGLGVGLHRSESYTPASSSSVPVAVNYAGLLPVKPPLQPSQHSQQPVNHLKRAVNHVGFYKEISLEETGSGSSSSSNREPPPKLTRLHSAPASATITNAAASSSIPFKIDILPTLPAASAGSSRHVPATAPASSSNYKITYKFEPLANKEPAAAASRSTIANQQPVIKLDYSNLKLPMTAAPGSSPHPKAPPQSTATRHHPLQPTIKIDLSSITNFSASNHSPVTSSSSSSNSSPSVKQVPSTPSTPLSSSSGVSSTGSGSRNPYIFSPGASSSSASAAAAATAPIYSSVSSTIAGMDEDYDDI